MGKTATKAVEKAEEKKEAELTSVQAKMIEGLTTVSSKIRYLDTEGYSRSQIAKALGKRYQHVRNVLITPVAKAKA